VRVVVVEEQRMSSETMRIAVPHPITPGPEMAALHRFFRDVTWTGTIVAGGMGPGSPEMHARGRGVHRTIQGGLWIVGDYEQDQFLPDGTFILTWRLHWVVGWDPDRATYVATHHDNYGHAGLMYGERAGDVLTLETPAGAAGRQRLTWDLSDPDAVVWRNEAAVGDGDLAEIEVYHCTPVSPTTG
jgi:hypothetical protein